MQKFTDNLAEEATLINQVKNGKEDALKKLYIRYQPLVNSIINKYYLRCYDKQDWEQDALFICYQSAISYVDGKGKFASYYKTRLTNHAKTLVRYENAYRRRALTQSISIEKAVASGLRPLQVNQVSPSEVPLNDQLAEIIDHLSDLEGIALLVVLGIVPQEEVLANLKIEKKSLIRAKSRLVQKMRYHLL
ncbi:sigma factor [Lactobacillus sp. ESL0230]|uniref:sigma factor n=1 Tax=Lactobacillus sp. ESL0230 TaxID=2069353 RepID=UPI000EFB49CE|nr:sigma factor [Lactobacillus sp. ESL0230]RMC45236.1 sigma-70 family RNA polymerase sigma factor [Lactobacillus sp. ESL0230]